MESKSSKIENSNTTFIVDAETKELIQSIKSSLDDLKEGRFTIENH